MILLWNSRISLTAIRDPQEIIIKHFFDSLTLLPYLPGSSSFSLIDIGTGAGFPGIPLKILFPQMHLTLVESVQKKAAFCEQVIHKLGFTNAEVRTERAEELGQAAKFREQADVAAARAVAGLPTLLEYLFPLVKVGGNVLCQKGENAAEEVEQAKAAADALGGKLVAVKNIAYPVFSDKRYLVIYQKTSPTPAQFPRRVGVPLKRPIRP